MPVAGGGEEGVEGGGEEVGAHDEIKDGEAAADVVGLLVAGAQAVQGDVDLRGVGGGLGGLEHGVEVLDGGEMCAEFGGEGGPDGLEGGELGAEGLGGDGFGFHFDAGAGGEFAGGA